MTQREFPRPSGNGLVEVTSRVQVWWLTNLKGYRIVLVRHEPRLGSFGRIEYQSTWTLMRQDA